VLVQQKWEIFAAVMTFWFMACYSKTISSARTPETTGSSVEEIVDWTTMCMLYREAASPVTMYILASIRPMLSYANPRYDEK
jgi:hypothetical protein